MSLFASEIEAISKSSNFPVSSYTFPQIFIRKSFVPLSMRSAKYFPILRASSNDSSVKAVFLLQPSLMKAAVISASDLYVIITSLLS